MHALLWESAAHSSAAPAAASSIFCCGRARDSSRLNKLCSMIVMLRNGINESNHSSSSSWVAGFAVFSVASSSTPSLLLIRAAALTMSSSALFDAAVRTSFTSSPCSSLNYSALCTKSEATFDTIVPATTNFSFTFSFEPSSLSFSLTVSVASLIFSST